MSVDLLKVGRKLCRVFVKALAACTPPFYTIVLDLSRIPTAKEQHEGSAKHDKCANKCSNSCGSSSGNCACQSSSCRGKEAK